MLSVKNLEVVYNGVSLVLRGVSLEVPAGKIVALLGANGAGKTTLLRAISGLLDLHDGKVTKGEISLNGAPIHGLSAARIVKRGITQVLEGRRVFADFTVEENLRIGAFRSAGDRQASERRVYDLFPVLFQRRRSVAGYLSGGEQQQLAIGRALMSNPACLLLDEPSLGLAPLLVDQLRDLITAINAQGTTVLLVEQHAGMALAVAEHGYIMETGKVVMDRPAQQLLADADVREFYLGTGAQAEHAFRGIKHYRRRKRWLEH